MTPTYLLSIDIGGGGGRCLLANTKTASTISAYRSWKHRAAPEVGEWSFELDTDLVWRLIGEVSKDCLAKAGVSADQIVGIAASGMRHGMVVVDEKGETLLARPNQDARAASQSMALAGSHGDVIYNRTGHWPSPICPAPALMWMAEIQPEVYKQAHAVMSLSDWVGYKMTGVIRYEASQAAESALVDLKTASWADDLIKAAALPRHIFPQVVQAGAKLGELNAEAAEHLGLMPGTPVAAGGADTQSGLLGLGVINPGELGVIGGTTTPVQLVAENPIIDPEKRLWTSLHLLPGRYVLESNAGSMGTALEWIAQSFYSGHPYPVAALVAEATQSSPGASGIISTVGVSVFNAAAMSLPVDNLTFSSASRHGQGGGRPSLARSVLEGMAFGVCANLEQIVEVSGTDPQEIRVGGGMSQGDNWTQILSDASGKPILVAAVPEATALGAAICAGVGAGLFSDLAAGAQALSKIGRVHAPDQKSRLVYAGLYQDWKALRQERQEADELAASIITQGLETDATTAGDGDKGSFRPRIYVSADMGQTALEMLARFGEVTYASYREGNMLVGEDLVETLQGYHVFVTEVDILDAEALQGLPDLRMVAVCRGNPVNVDIKACTAAGVPVVNTPGRNADAVADLTLTFMLMLARKMQGAAAFLRQPGGEAGDMGRQGMAYFKYQGNELWGKTIGLVGAGIIGRKVIKRLLPFEAHVLVYDPYISPSQAQLFGARKVDLDELLSQSDFISLHAPVTNETQSMIDASAFDKMKEGVYLVNTARAALVDDRALIAALESEKLGGVALDVFSVEPPGSDDPVLAFENVIATPHLGGDTIEVGEHQGLIVASELKLLLAGKAPTNILNPQALDAFSWDGERHVSMDVLQELAQGPEPAVSDLVDGDPQREKKTPERDQEQKDGLIKRLLGKVDGVKDGLSKVDVSHVAVDEPGSQHEIMGRIIEQFTTNVAADPDLAKSSRGKDVLMHFTIKDLDQVFYLHFAETMGAAMGEPPVEPHVRLKMDADILDGMFTGRVSGNKAAMTGKLSFSGDTRKAMSLQRFIKHLNRLYTSARNQIGDPGDLTQLGVTPAVDTPTQFTSTDSPVGAVIQAPAVIKVGDIRDEILQVNNELYARGLITATGGNVSARADDDPEQVWITPSAIFKGDLRPDMMVRIDLDGNPLGDAPYSASSERRVHCAIYKARPEVTAVIHTHAPQATIMALTGTKFVPVSTELL